VTAPVLSLGTAGVPKGGAFEKARLLETAKQLEGLFVRQLYQAMRATVADDGQNEGGAAGATFQQLLDEEVADRTPAQWKHGLAEAIARQFTAPRAATPGLAPVSATTPTTAPEAP
jgi:Rod binding domain-containing protein